jgi:hypothetical protein
MSARATLHTACEAGPATPKGSVYEEPGGAYSCRPQLHYVCGSRPAQAANVEEGPFFLASRFQRLQEDVLWMVRSHGSAAVQAGVRLVSGRWRQREVRTRFGLRSRGLGPVTEAAPLSIFSGIP